MNKDMPGTIRKRLIVSGNVQEAGYRVFVKPIAKSMGIVGFVRNLPDETVEVVCEARPDTLEKFIKSIDRKGNPANPHVINVASIVETPAPEGGQYATFKIEYDGKLSPEERERNREIREERMIVGASILGEKVECVGKDVREVGQAVHGMHLDMNTRFDHMAEHYDMIAISLKEAIAHMARNAEKTDRAIEKSRKETVIAVRKSEERTAKVLAKSRQDTILEVRKSEERTARILRESRKDVADSNRELAGAVKFMIRKLSDRPARKRPAGKRKR